MVRTSCCNATQLLIKAGELPVLISQMDELTKLFAGLFGPSEADDPFAQHLRNGNFVKCENVEIELDRRGVPFKWSRYECLHLTEIQIRYTDNQYVVTGSGRFELDNWSCTIQGDSEQKANDACQINVQFAWPNSVSQDMCQGVTMFPGRLRAVIQFLREKYQKEKNA